MSIRPDTDRNIYSQFNTIRENIGKDDISEEIEKKNNIDNPSVEENVEAKQSSFEQEMYNTSLHRKHNPHLLKFSMSITKLGQLGNNMFQYAVLMGLSRRTGHRPILPNTFSHLEQLFNLSIPKSDKRVAFRNYVKVEEPFAKNAFKTIANVTKLTNKNVRMYGLFQSYQYFDNVLTDLRKDFTLMEPIKSEAVEYINKLLPRKRPTKVTTVGIHVRMGMMAIWLQLQGYVLTPITFFHKAMDYFRTKYKNVYFIICSDDKTWVTENLMANGTVNMFQSYAEDGQMDFAILSSCDHMITTRGTFGWWAGWIVKGTTVYYKYYHPDDSPAALVHPDWSYIPQVKYNSWISIGK